MKRILFLNLAAVAVSCVPIDGGAVEANWVVRSEDGRAINDCACTDPPIIFVRLNLLGVSPPEIKGTEPCRDRPWCGFGCQSQTGASRFDIPPGSYLMSVTPTDAVGYDLTTPGPDGARRVQVPAPVLREVVHGQPTQLDAFSIIAGCAEACGGAKRNQECSR
jgi:hypothetical protein